MEFNSIFLKLRTGLLFFKMQLFIFDENEKDYGSGNKIYECKCVWKKEQCKLINKI